MPTIGVMDVRPVAHAVTSAASAQTTAATTTPTAPASFADRFAAAQKALRSGEHLQQVAGHAYARIKGGERDDMYLNLSGNGRSGQAFDLIRRDGRSFHVYGSGSGRVVVAVPTAATRSPAAARTGGVAADA